MVHPLQYHLSFSRIQKQSCISQSSYSTDEAFLSEIIIEFCETNLSGLSKSGPYKLNSYSDCFSSQIQNVIFYLLLTQRS